MPRDKDAKDKRPRGTLSRSTSCDKSVIGPGTFPPPDQVHQLAPPPPPGETHKTSDHAIVAPSLSMIQLVPALAPRAKADLRRSIVAAVAGSGGLPPWIN